MTGTNVTITIDMDKPCAECHRGGAVESGICLACTLKAMRTTPRLRSAIGRAIQNRFSGERLRRK